MRVLFVAPHFPWPPNTGGKLRTVALLRALAKRHCVTLASPVEATADGLSAGDGVVRQVIGLPQEAMQRLGFVDTGSRLGKLYAYAADCLRMRTPYVYSLQCMAMAHVLDGACDDHEAIFCRYGLMLPLVPRRAWARVVLDMDDFLYRMQRQEALYRPFRPYKALRLVESLRTYRFEQRVFRRVAHTLACSDHDLKRIRCGAKSVVRNGIDLPPAELLAAAPSPRTLAFVGVCSYPPNVKGLKWFVEQVWPSVRRQCPDARLNIVGTDATAERLPFAVAPGIEIVGPVDKTAPWFSSAVATVVPLRIGSGTRIKILESLACGRPAVSTVLGAEGMERLDKSCGVFRVKDAAEMASRLVELLNDPAAAGRAGLAGKKIVEAEYSWGATTAGLADDVERWVRGPARE